MQRNIYSFARGDLVLYLAWEFGTRGAARILRGLKPYGDSNDPYPHPPTSDGWLWRYRTQHHGQRGLAHIKMAIAYQRGRVGRPMGANVFQS
jgi:hypothetical protein